MGDGAMLLTGQQQAAGVLVLIAAALLVVPGGGPALPRRRTPRVRDPATRRMLVTGVGVVAAGMLLSITPWLVAVLAAGCMLAVRMLPVRRRPLDVDGMRDLAGTLDLLATCLDAGQPIGRSITAVLSALRESGRDGRVAAGNTPPESAAPLAALAEVAALLALGADPPSAWRPAAAQPELASLAAAARRSAMGGVRLADAVREAAAELRGRCRAAADRSAARAGVAMTAPLALCFLPAFVCLGLAPVVISLVSTLQIW